MCSVLIYELSGACLAGFITSLHACTMYNACTCIMYYAIVFVVLLNFNRFCSASGGCEIFLCNYIMLYRCFGMYSNT